MKYSLFLIDFERLSHRTNFSHDLKDFYNLIFIDYRQEVDLAISKSHDLDPLTSTLCESVFRDILVLKAKFTLSLE